MKIICSIQARMNSKRLPGKVLLESGGKPFLIHQVERIKKSRLIDKIIIATSDNPLDDDIENLCKKNEIAYFRGPENDVLERLSLCLYEYKDWLHVELVGDSPFVDYEIVNEFIGYYLKYSDTVDYVTNGLEITYPNGSEVNIYKTKLLLEANETISKDNLNREHVDINIYKSDSCRVVNLEAPNYLHRPDLFIEIDTINDYKVLKSIGDNFAGKDYFSLHEIIDYLDNNPHVANLNKKEYRKYLERGVKIKKNNNFS